LPRRRRALRLAGAVAEAEGAGERDDESTSGDEDDARPDAHGMIANPAAGMLLSAADD